MGDSFDGMDFCFTVFGISGEWVQCEGLRGILARCSLRYVIFGRETCPETGRKHLQGFAQFRNQLEDPAAAFRAIQRQLGADCQPIHFEPRRGSVQQAQEYCRKEGNYVEYGNLRDSGNDDIIEAIEQGTPIKELIKGHPNLKMKVRQVRDLYALFAPKVVARPPVRAYVLWGLSGTGKTTLVDRFFGEDVYHIADNNTGSFQNYSGEKCLCFDGFDPSIWTLGAIEPLVKNFQKTVNIKNGVAECKWEFVFFTGQYPPQVWWPLQMNRSAVISRIVKVWEVNSFDQLPDLSVELA